MLTLPEMRELARSRIADAIALVKAGRYDGAVYLCGYAAEMAIKARIFRTLGWTQFPDSDHEWEKHHRVFKVHDLPLLLKYSGYEVQLSNPPHAAHWNRVQDWNPETRYKLTRNVTELQAKQMIRSTLAIVNLLNPA